MNCDSYGPLISKWVDGEAKADEAARAEAHVASCAPCRKLADEFRRNAGLIEAALGPEPIGRRVAGGVFGAIARREAVLRWGARLAVAAGILAAILLVQRNSDAERQRVSDQVQAAMRVVDRMAATLDAERARQAAVDRASRDGARRELDRLYAQNWYLQEQLFSLVPVEDRDRIRHGLDNATSPDHVAGSGAPRRPDGADPRPGTVALDRVDASADFETGAVAVAWRMDRAPGAVWFVFRRPAGSDDWGAALNPEPLSEPKFEDASAKGLATYEYRVVAFARGTFSPSDEIARVKTPPDLRIEFKGGGKEFKGDGSSGVDATWMFTVSARTGGKWTEETFRVKPGEPIGGARGGVDYTTGVSLLNAGESVEPRTNFRMLRAELSSAPGRFLLWKGERASGSRGNLDVDARR